MWRVDNRATPDPSVHVWPDDDTHDHDLTQPACTCGPIVQAQPDGTVLVIHRLDA